MDLEWADLWAAIALMLIIEGILPFLNPASFRQMLQALGQVDDKIIRILGGCWMGLGLIVLFLVRG